MNLSMNRFNDVQTHASAVNDWRQTYSQISAGNLQSSLAQIKSQRLHAFREQINQRVVQHGEAPRGKVCFAVPIAIPGAIRMQGREADETSLFVLRGGEEFMFHMPMGMDMLSLTFDSELFDHALDDSPEAENIEKLLKQPVIRIPTHRFSECRRRLVAMFSEAIADGTARTQTGFAPNLEGALLDELMELLADPPPEVAGAATHVRSQLHRRKMPSPHGVRHLQPTECDRPVRAPENQPPHDSETASRTSRKPPRRTTSGRSVSMAPDAS